MLKIALALVVISLLAAAPAHAKPSSAPAPFPWIDGQANALLVDGDTVYVGGEFTAVGKPAGPLVLADGAGGSILKRFTGLATYHSWGTTPPRWYFSLLVNSVISDGAGGWYAGGRFTNIDGAFRSGVVHVRPDGSLDPAFNTIDLEGAGSLALVGDRLFVSWDDIYAYDAHTGERLDWSVDADSVNALVGAGNTLYVADYAGARAYDALSGERLPFMPPIRNRVTDVAVAGDTVYLAGDFGAGAFRRSDGVRLPTQFADVVKPEYVRASAHAVVWGGEKLIASDPATGANLGWFGGASGGPIAVDGDRVYKRDSAYSLVDGSRLPWNPGLYGGTGSGKGTIAAGGGKVLIGGTPMATDAVARSDLAAFSLSTGAVLPFAPTVEGYDWVTVQALATHDGALYVGGRFARINGAVQSSLAKLDAVTGARLPFPGYSGGLTVYALATAGDTLFAGGNDGLFAYDTQGDRQLDWDPGLDCGASTLVVSGAKLFAGGCEEGEGMTSFRLPALEPVPSVDLPDRVSPRAADGAGGVWVSGNEAPRLWHVSASDQVLADAPTVDGSVSAVVAQDGVLTVAGTFNRIQGQLHPGVAQVRLADGALTTFNPGVESVHALSALPGEGLLLVLDGPATGLGATGPVARFGPTTATAPLTLMRGPRIVGAAVGQDTLPPETYTDGGEWSGPIAARTVRWLRCDAAGNACVEADDELTAEEAGHRMRVEVTVFNDAGSTTVLSDPGPLLGFKPSFKTGRAPTATGTTRVGETLHADPGATNPASEITYYWTRCNPSGFCQTINRGSTTLTLTAADAGQRISFTSIARNQFGKSLPWTVSFSDSVTPGPGATPTATPSTTATPTATATATATPTPTPSATTTTPPASSPEPTATATAEPTATAAPTPPPVPDRLIVADRKRTSAGPAPVPKVRVTTTRTRVTVTLTALAADPVTVRLFQGRTVLGRATVRPQSRRATVTLTKQGRTAVRQHRRITIEIRTAAHTTRTRIRL